MPLKTFRTLVFLCITLIVFCSSSCSKDSDTQDFMTRTGTVIGKEYCKSDTTKDYWLVNLDTVVNKASFGDTAQIDDTTYNHVVKTLQLPDGFRVKGLRITVDFKKLSDDKVTSTDCFIQTPVTYSLKELHILYIGKLN
jgi:hypothetical protein